MKIEGIRQIAIIGVGLLGGSLGLAVKRLCRRTRIVGVGRRLSTLKQAKAIGAIDTIARDLSEAIGESDLVILATPIGAFEDYLRRIKPLLKKGAMVTDVGSAKADVVAAAGRILGASGPFVGSHPMAGSEKKGPGFAQADLFKGRVCIVTPGPKTPKSAIAKIERFWKALGMNVIQMTPASHDRAVASVSHLPHLLSCLLMTLPNKAQLLLAAGGFRDMTRLAGGDHEMWRDILLTNKRNILAGLNQFRKKMAVLHKRIDSGRAGEIEKFLISARQKRDIAINRSLDHDKANLEVSRFSG